MKKIFIAVVVAGVLGGALYFFLSTGPAFQGGTPPFQFELPKPSDIGKLSGRQVPAGTKEYYSSQYHFSLLYPDMYQVHEYEEEGGGRTVTFEYDDGKEASGFQIYIVPFAGGQITDEQFKKDVPSGVRQNLKEVTIDGAVGASFYSKDEVLGDTAEVWFAKGGYLYEISTFKELDTWLADILATWAFTP